MNRSLVLPAALAALALGACTPDFDPASQVDKLRVAAVKATPPEIDPDGVSSAPDRASLETLVLRPDFDAAAVPTTTIVHLACLPEPGNPLATACQTFESLRDLGALAGAVASTACAPDPDSATTVGAPFLVGVEACASWSCGAASAGGAALRRAELVAPPGYFDALAAADPGFPGDPTASDLIVGVQAVVLSFAIDATPDELVQGAVTTCAEADLVAGLARLWPERQHVLATKRVHVRGPASREGDPNLNPEIDALVAGATTLVEPETTLAGGTVNLRPRFTEASRQLYSELDASGAVIETLREEWVYSWFATAGEIDELHTRGGEHDAWTVSGKAAGRPALVAAVVRDLRGGTGWAVRRVILTR
jgi:hypothetical protein